MHQLLLGNCNSHFRIEGKSNSIDEPNIWFGYDFHKAYSRSVKIYVRSKSTGIVGGFSGVLHSLLR